MSVEALYAALRREGQVTLPPAHPEEHRPVVAALRRRAKADGLRFASGLPKRTGYRNAPRPMRCYLLAEDGMTILPAGS